MTRTKDKDYIVLIDMDQVVNDLLTPWVKCLNEWYGYNVDVNTITEWNLAKTFSNSTKDEIIAPLRTEELWKEITPIPGAIEGLEKLIQEGYNVKLCTASCPESFFYKYKHFISNYLPFMRDKNRLICIENKQLIKANVLFDDNIDNLIGGEYKGVLFNANYNQQFDAAKYGVVRVNSWSEFTNFIQRDYAIYKLRKQKEKNI